MVASLEVVESLVVELEFLEWQLVVAEVGVEEKVEDLVEYVLHLDE